MAAFELLLGQVQHGRHGSPGAKGGRDVLGLVNGVLRELDHEVAAHAVVALDQLLALCAAHKVVHQAGCRR